MYALITPLDGFLGSRNMSQLNVSTLFHLDLLPLDKYMIYKKVCFINDCMGSSKKIFMFYSKWWCRSKECYHIMEQYRLCSLHYVQICEKLW